MMLSLGGIALADTTDPVLGIGTALTANATGYITAAVALVATVFGVVWGIKILKRLFNKA
jgi:hypothetical protein